MDLLVVQKIPILEEERSSMLIADSDRDSRLG